MIHINTYLRLCNNFFSVSLILLRFRSSHFQRSLRSFKAFFVFPIGSILMPQHFAKINVTTLTTAIIIIPFYVFHLTPTLSESTRESFLVWVIFWRTFPSSFDEILKPDGCKISTREFLKINWTHQSFTTAEG